MKMSFFVYIVFESNLQHVLFKVALGLSWFSSWKNIFTVKPSCVENCDMYLQLLLSLMQRVNWGNCPLRTWSQHPSEQAKTPRVCITSRKGVISPLILTHFLAFSSSSLFQYSTFCSLFHSINYLHLHKICCTLLSGRERL